MGLRAVVFDYGLVLSGPPDPEARAVLQRLTGLSAERFDSLYWSYRHAYDEGKLTAREFWRKLTLESGLNLSDAAIEELSLWDARMWTTVNPAMLAWHEQLKRRGLRTGILSNMGDNVLANMEREYGWLTQFDALAWSFQLHMAKPEPAIYHYVLEKLGAQAEETLFIDDKPVNAAAAQALGMKAMVFETTEKLRGDLIAAGLDSELPLP